MNLELDITNDNDAPADLDELLVMAVEQSVARHGRLRQDFRALADSQAREMEGVRRSLENAVVSLQERAGNEIGRVRAQGNQLIARLQDDLRTLPLRVSPRVNWLLIFVRDNPSYFAEKQRIGQKIIATTHGIEPAASEVRRRSEIEVDQLRVAFESESLGLGDRHDSDLRILVNEGVSETEKLESVVIDLTSVAKGLPGLCNGGQSPTFVRMASIRYDFVPWDGVVKTSSVLPWIVSVSQARGIVVSGEAMALQWIHSWIFGMLGSFPPGLLKMSIFDPELLGSPYSRWLELGDSPADLLGGKIWTETREIETRLSELKAHVVRVTQRLLRDEYADLNAYNRAHPESQVASEIVIIQQPSCGWWENVKDLISQLFISGPRCGIFPCILVPSGGEFPPAFADTQNTETLCILDDGSLSGSVPGLWEGLNPTWIPDPDCGSLVPVNRLRQIAQEATQRSSVSVDYDGLLRDFGICSEDDVPKSTADGLRIPIGRNETGAISQLELGTESGTHHALIGGRPGSGKSTLLHTIINSAARIHGPDELEVFLLDFKQGSEFMPYASMKLPHAKVVSVDSCREFGLSVLMFLEGELARRSTLFRRSGAGVQDLQEFRRTSDAPMPRMLVVIDEFQVLFGGKDSIADEAASRFDNIIRQSRSYGLHVILATQALTASWSLSANTLSLISIRIALSCDERVSRQILGDENKEAQQLSRPGEAIYNDRNGLVLHNSRFQVANFQRDLLGDMVHRIAVRHGELPFNCTVFDGSVLPDGKSCLEEFRSGSDTCMGLELGTSSEMGISPRIELEPREGQNLILFSQDEDMRLWHLRSVLECLRPQRVETILVDASRKSETDKLSPGSGRAQHSCVKVVDLPALLARLRNDCENALDSGTLPNKKLLIIYGPQNVESLRLDPIQAATNPRGAATANDLDFLLKVGPELGLHFVLVANRPDSFRQSIDPRGKLIDRFDLRASTRLPVDDARHVFPDAKAAKLGSDSGILYRLDRNESMGYRPYEWQSGIAGVDG